MNFTKQTSSADRAEIIIGTEKQQVKHKINYQTTEKAYSKGHIKKVNIISYLLGSYNTNIEYRNYI